MLTISHSEVIFRVNFMMYLYDVDNFVPGSKEFTELEQAEKFYYDVEPLVEQAADLYELEAIGHPGFGVSEGHLDSNTAVTLLRITVEEFIPRPPEIELPTLLCSDPECGWRGTARKASYPYSGRTDKDIPVCPRCGMAAWEISVTRPQPVNTPEEQAI